MSKIAKKGNVTVMTLLAIIGVICWVLQLTNGMQLTNLNNYDMWGLYVIGFVVFTGIAAGSLMFSSSAYIFQAMVEYKPYARIAAFVGALGGVITAGLFIMADVGNPVRAWRIMANANIASPMFWDNMILTAYVIIGIVLTYQLIMVQEGKKEEKDVTVISWIAFIAGLLVMVTSFVFAMQVSSPLWNNPVEPVSFLAAAIVAALSFLIITFASLNKTGYIEISSNLLSKMGQLAAIFLLFELFVVLGEALIGLYAGTGEEAKIIRWLVAGKGAPFFWAELIAIVMGLVLFCKKNSGTTINVAGASVSLFAICMIKYNFLQAQLFNPLISYAGPAVSTPHGVYLPSLVEVGISVGIIALAGLLVMIGLNKLNLGTGSKLSSTDSMLSSNKGNVISS